MHPLGDTVYFKRRKIKETTSIGLTNPDDRINQTLKTDISKDLNKTPFQQTHENNDQSEIEEDDANGLMPSDTSSALTSPRQQPKEKVIERTHLTDEEILRLLPRSESTNQNAQRLLECKDEGCKKVATKECSGYCPDHFCEYYRRGQVDIPGCLDEATARGYGDKTSSDEPEPYHWRPDLPVPRHTSSGSGGNSPKTPRTRRAQDHRTRREKSSTRMPGAAGASGSSSEGQYQRPQNCVGVMCKNMSTSGPLCDECKDILKKTKKPKKAKSYPCAFTKCKKPSYEKGKLCRSCAEYLSEERARMIPAPRPDEVLPGQGPPKLSPPFDAFPEVPVRPMTRINTPPAFQVNVNVGKVENLGYEPPMYHRQPPNAPLDDPLLPTYPIRPVHDDREDYYGARPRAAARKPPQPTYQESQPRYHPVDGRRLDVRRVEEDHSRRHKTRDTEDHRRRRQREQREKDYIESKRYEEMQPERNYHHQSRRAETLYESSQFPRDSAGYERRDNDRYDHRPTARRQAEMVKFSPSEIETESPPSSFISEADTCSVQDDHDLRLHALSSFGDDQPRYDRNNSKPRKYGSEGNRSNEFSSVTDIPPRHPCKNPRCDNYGNDKCDGFCNSCYGKLRR